MPWAWCCGGWWGGLCCGSGGDRRCICGVEVIKVVLPWFEMCWRYGDISERMGSAWWMRLMGEVQIRAAGVMIGWAGS